MSLCRYRIMLQSQSDQVDVFLVQHPQGAGAAPGAAAAGAAGAPPDSATATNLANGQTYDQTSAGHPTVIANGHSNGQEGQYQQPNQPHPQHQQQQQPQRHGPGGPPHIPIPHPTQQQQPQPSSRGLGSAGRPPPLQAAALAHAANIGSAQPSPLTLLAKHYCGGSGGAFGGSSPMGPGGIKQEDQQGGAERQLPGGEHGPLLIIAMAPNHCSDHSMQLDPPSWGGNKGIQLSLRS